MFFYLNIRHLNLFRISQFGFRLFSVAPTAACFYLNIRHFEFVSYFALRISDFLLKVVGSLRSSLRSGLVARGFVRHVSAGGFQCIQIGRQLRDARRDHKLAGQQRLQAAPHSAAVSWLRK